MSQPGISFSLGGYFILEARDRSGKLKFREAIKNGVTNQALNSVLNVYLGSGTKIADWYLGLIDNAGFTEVAAGDTMASHAGWAESSAYSQTNRPAWVPNAASSQSMAGSTSVEFTINASVTIRGAFLCSDNTKGGSSGTLFATAIFSGGNQILGDGDTLKVTYVVNATPS